MNEQEKQPWEGEPSAEGSDPTSDEQMRQAEAWKEVGQQFQNLGSSLATAIRVAWNDEDNRRRLEQMKQGLESMAEEVGKAIKESASSDAAKRVRGEAGKAAGSVKSAGSQTLQDLQPRIKSALTAIQDEIRKLIDRVRGEGGGKDEGGVINVETVDVQTEEPEREGPPQG